MRLITNFIVLFFSFGTSNLMAVDFGQTLSGSQVIDTFEKDLQSRKEEEVEYPSMKQPNKGFLESSVKLNDYEDEIAKEDAESNSDSEVKEINPHLPGALKETEFTKKHRNDVFGQSGDGQFSKDKEYHVYTNDELLSEKFNQADHSYSLLIIKDTYDYFDEGGVYKKTFEESPEGSKIGGFHLDYRRYISKGIINTHWGMSFGIGHSRGKGVFVDNNQVSRATFQIWTFPVDLWLGLEMRLTKAFKVSVAGGPSILPIWQSRNDREDKDIDKEYQQLGTGYSGLAKFQINWSGLSSGTGFKYLSGYGISNFYFDLLARYQSYDNFKDNITVSGMSFGIGFTFEYL